MHLFHAGRGGLCRGEHCWESRVWSRVSSGLRACLLRRCLMLLFLLPRVPLCAPSCVRRPGHESQAPSPTHHLSRPPPGVQIAADSPAAAQSFSQHTRTQNSSKQHTAHKAAARDTPVFRSNPSPSQRWSRWASRVHDAAPIMLLDAQNVSFSCVPALREQHPRPGRPLMQAASPATRARPCWRSSLPFPAQPLLSYPQNSWLSTDILPAPCRPAARRRASL